jgi:hypothetical protein
MPNYCYNLVEVEGEEKEIKRLVDFVSTKDNEFDFESVLPYPKEWKELDNKVAQMRDDNIPFDKIPKDGYNQGGYEWCIRTWGTKWNSIQSTASDVQEIPNREGVFRVDFEFDTAWSPSTSVTEALSKEFPTLLFIHKFEEGGCDFSGEYMFEGGECISAEDGEYDDFPITNHDEFRDYE